MYSILFRSSIFKALALCLLLLFGVRGEGYGQRVYADAQRNGTTGTVGSGSVTNPTFSIDASNLSNFTRLSASSAVLASGGAWQQLIFDRTFAGNTTIYIKLNVASSLLGGSVTLKTYSGSTANTDGNEVASSSNSFTAIDGTTYLAVTGNISFNAVRVTLSAPALLGSSTADIYYAFYEPVNKRCADVLGVSVGGTGISLGGGVSNPLNAVDNNLTTYSSLTGGLLGLGYTITQTAYFSNLSNPGDAATITFSLPPSLLQLSLFNNVTINLYNGNTLVNTGTIGSLLSLDLLGLLRSGQRYTVSLSSTPVFDRIEIAIATGVSLLTDFRIHEIQRTPAKPTVPIAYPQVQAVCYGQTATLTAAPTSSGSVLRWYNQVNDGTLIQEGSPYITPPITVAEGDTAFFYVAATWNSACPAESERVKVAVVANSLPSITLSPLASMCQGETSVSIAYTTTTNSPTSYSITWTDSPTDFINVVNQMLTPNSINLSVPGSAAIGTYSGILKVKSANGCVSSEISFSVEIHPKPSPPHITAN
ncbi:hypothetical protein QT327_10815 [Olivibacter sp. 47]|uniref:immunoglobulin domain-containing protein n=1 Tax=Olivibacter sp. 47 TaxID=3056486 RepID=UPI0025A31598|nr:hypothetical protein [Olivibacter sp. 47]MDM8174840.1 hypothetical protein [Olivibacter sp. 47]